MPNNATALVVPLNQQTQGKSRSGRLQRPDQLFRARELCEIARQGVQPDATVVELACGAGDMTRALANLVPQGRAIGLDSDPATVARAQTTAHLERTQNVRFMPANIRRLPIQSAYADITVARFVLQTSLDPDRVIEEMIRVTRPGGLVVCIDAHADSVAISPAPHGMGRLLSAARMTRRMHGGDPRMGRRIARLMQDAGLDHISENQVLHSSQGIGLVRFMDAAFSSGVLGVDLGDIDPDLMDSQQVRTVLNDMAQLDGRAGTLARARVTVATGRVALH